VPFEDDDDVPAAPGTIEVEPVFPARAAGGKFIFVTNGTGMSPPKSGKPASFFESVLHHPTRGDKKRQGLGAVEPSCYLKIVVPGDGKDQRGLLRRDGSEETRVEGGSCAPGHKEELHSGTQDRQDQNGVHVSRSRVRNIVRLPAGWHSLTVGHLQIRGAPAKAKPNIRRSKELHWFAIGFLLGFELVRFWPMFGLAWRQPAGFSESAVFRLEVPPGNTISLGRFCT